MANTTSKQILIDGYRNAVVKLAGTLDTSDITLAPAIALSDFTNNDAGYGAVVGLRVDKIDYTSGPSLNTILEWESTTPQLLAALAQSGVTEMQKVGGAKPDRTAIGYTGAINLRTKGFTAGEQEGYTVVLHMIKIYAE